MHSRPSSSYGPGTVKEHAARIRGRQHHVAPASAHVPIIKQSLVAPDGSSTAAAAANGADAPLSSLVVLPSSATKVEYTRFKGCKHFRERLVCATLSGKPIRIDEIRSLDERPGIRDFEASFLRLLEKVTNGCSIQINNTGTSLKYKPGLMIGGHILGLTHACPNSRSIGYFVEPLLKLSLFSKKALVITLTGITNDELDPSVDIIRTVSLNLLKKFGIEDAIELKIKKRGAPPEGGGEVLLKVPVVKALSPIDLLDEGKIKRVRGIAYTTKISPQIANRVVDGARGILNNLLPDVYIYTDHFKGKDSGLSPGYGLTLVAESTSGALLSAELIGREGETPEDLGKKVAELLCEEIARGGVCDSQHQSLMLLMMILCPEDVSKVRLGALTPYTIDSLRLYKEMFGVQFKLKTDAESNTIIASCLGIGFKNLTRRIA
jgi:RNA 3'-terminal phosphate cyclase-like protein